MTKVSPQRGNKTGYEDGMRRNIKATLDLKSSNLKVRRTTGDMIEVFNINNKLSTKTGNLGWKNPSLKGRKKWKMG